MKNYHTEVREATPQSEKVEKGERDDDDGIYI